MRTLQEWMGCARFAPDPRVVVQAVAGSNPVAHPNSLQIIDHMPDAYSWATSVADRARS
jgi:hypothetical protein